MSRIIAMALLRFKNLPFPHDEKTLFQIKSDVKNVALFANSQLFKVQYTLPTTLNLILFPIGVKITFALTMIPFV